MSTFRGANHSRWFHTKSSTYNPAAAEPKADGHEMLDFNMLSPPVLEPDTVSLQSSSTPLLRLPGPEAAAYMDDSLGFREEGEQKPKYFQGWRMGVTLCAATTGTVMMINVILTVVAYTKYGLSGGLGTLQEGSCRKTKELSLWLHVVINVLSTLLLGASNYCMQCLTSPTREEVDNAHSDYVWLDIGVPSVRNLTRISRKRALLWLILGISSVPLHLFYNSAVFSTLSTQDYAVFATSSDLFNTAGLNWSAPVSYYDFTLQTFRNASSWEKLDNSACIKAYGQEYVSARGDLLIMTSDLNSSVPIETVTNSKLGGQPYAWICIGIDVCNINTVLEHSTNWTIASGADTYLAQYCLSEPVEERCRVQFSNAVMIIVIGCNFLKALCMFLTLWLQEPQPLVTLGDAIESFLRRMDPITEGMCLADTDWFSQAKWGKAPIKWKGLQHRWFSSASRPRWLTCNILCICTLIAASCLLGLGLVNGHFFSDPSLSHLWQMGYGAVTIESIIYWNLPGSNGLLHTALVANSPQVLLSFLYLAYNSLFTCMLLAKERNSYAHDRKALRVTSPTGVQRSTYRLQLPYKYGVPLLIISGTLHWLVSQSLFLARVGFFLDDGEEDPSGSYATVGYSCIAIITVIILVAIVILLGVLNGFRRYKPGIPHIGSCSAAISAACHRPKEDDDAAEKPLMWGVVGMKDGVGHCCFTSFEVTPPVEGEIYAGLPEQD